MQRLIICGYVLNRNRKVAIFAIPSAWSPQTKNIRHPRQQRGIFILPLYFLLLVLVLRIAIIVFSFLRRSKLSGFLLDNC
ncbi:hypothetical protein P3L10_008156 [Capsicum annuum]